MEEGQNLKSLGNQNTQYAVQYNPGVLEVFENRYPENDYMITLSSSEVTALCPKTAQPDFYSVAVEYVPDKLCIESKGFKLYLFSFRNHGAFIETMTNMIADDLFKVAQPRCLKVTNTMNPRGGIPITVVVCREK